MAPAQNHFTVKMIDALCGVGLAVLIVQDAMTGLFLLPNEGVLENNYRYLFELVYLHV